MYLVDTDIIIWTIRGNSKYIKLLDKLKDKSVLAISTVTIAEIYQNAFSSEFLKTEQILNEYISCEVTPMIAKQAGLYWQYYSKKIKNISLIDCIIAATTRENKATLISLNVRHFPMEDIKLFNLN